VSDRISENVCSLLEIHCLCTISSARELLKIIKSYCVAASFTAKKRYCSSREAAAAVVARAASRARAAVEQGGQQEQLIILS